MYALVQVPVEASGIGSSGAGVASIRKLPTQVPGWKPRSSEEEQVL